VTAIRKHALDFAAIIGLLVLAIGVSSFILTHERLTLPSWVPVIGKDFYEFNGDFETGQAVTPGQGQTVNVAGVKVGEIAKVTLVRGVARLGLRLDDKHVHVHKDATLLLRPKTGLKDMTVELNPGTARAGRLPEGGTIPIGQTQPDVNLDELLSALDGDTRTYLISLVTNAGQGLQGRGKDLGDTLRTFTPTARALERINGALATRRQNIKRVMHNFSLVADELGRHDDDLAHFVNTNGAVLRVLAHQQADIRATLRRLPSALTATRSGLQKTGALADQLGPAFADLEPGARALGPMQRALRPFFRQTTPVIRDSVRPLVRETRPVITQLRPAIRSLSKATPDLYSSLKTLNRALNVLAYNPPGVEEGYLFWLSWANHLGANVFNTQDAHGPIRRGAVVVGCDALAVLDQVAAVNEVLGTTIGLINLPRTSSVCSQAQGQTR
jgi:phospholipid/cholesterol/gamma-HCH transport system substrate-binding protein